MSFAAMIEAKEMIDPTERSTQPSINITVIPQASKRLNVTVTSVLLKFEMCIRDR